MSPVNLTVEHLRRMNIGKRYWPAEVTSIHGGPHKDVVDKYVKDLARNVRSGWGLFLWGDNSVGKTYIACSVLKECVRAGFSGYCTLADELRSIYIDGPRFDADQSVVQRVQEVDALVLEDVGKEYVGKGSGWAELCLENMLRKRSRELRPVIATTNLTPAAFKERFQKSAAAIAMESMVAVEVKGDDLRKLLAAEKAKEFR